MLSKKPLITFVFFIVINLLYSQDNKFTKRQIDSVLNPMFNSIIINNTTTANSKSTLAMEFYTEAKQQGYKFGQCIGAFNLANKLSNLKMYDKSLRYLNTSKQLASQIKNDSLLLYCNFYFAKHFYNVGLYTKSLKLLDSCIDKVDCLKTQSKYVLLGDLYLYKAMNLQETSSANKNDIYKLYKQSEQYYRNSLRKPNYGLLYLGVFKASLKELDSAEYYYKLALKDFKKKKAIPQADIIYYNLTQLHLYNGNYLQAEAFADSTKAIAKPNRNFEVLKWNSNHYKKLFENIKATDSVIKYQALEIAYQDSLFADINTRTKTTLNFLETTQASNATPFYIRKRCLITGIIAVCIMVSIFIAKQYKRRKKLQEDNRKLVSNTINSQSTEIVRLKKRDVNTYDKLIVLAKKNDSLFIEVFKQLYPEFYKALITIQPHLTSHEIKICFYIKLNFSTKEIAEYTFVSTKAMQNRKNRLRKRLNLEPGENSYLFLDTLATTKFKQD